MRLGTIANALLLSACADAAGIIHPNARGNFPSVGEHTAARKASRFPMLTRLRDSLVESVFGPPPKKYIPPEPPAAVFSDYEDQVVLRFNVSTFEEEKAIADSAARLILDIWAFTEDYVDIRTRKETIGPLLSTLPESLRSAYWTLIPDVADLVHSTFPSSSSSSRFAQSFHSYEQDAEYNPLTQAEGDNLFFRDYQPLSVITPWMRLVEAMFPAIAELFIVGRSYEGRDILGLKLGVQKPKDAAHKRKVILVTGGMHAREWISTTTVNYLAWSFATHYGKEPMITKLLEHFDIVFIPVLNPDGMEYTWEVDRLWRKTRQDTGLQFCRGFDLDRAFGFEWNNVDTSQDPCSESYGGDQPWQAVEAAALAEWARNAAFDDNVQFVGLVDLHSYSQQVMFPFSYTCDVEPPNVEKLEELSVGLAKAIRLSSGESYAVSSACEGAVTSRGTPGKRKARVEAGGGSAIDWFYHELGAHFSYQIKLRDTGSYGFLLPKEHIVPTGEEIFNAMKYFGDYLLGNNGIEMVEKGGTGTSESADVLPEDEEEMWYNAELRRRKR